MTIEEKILDSLKKYTTKLHDVVLKSDDVVNNCVSTSTNLPLSAAQGKVLQDQITAIQNQRVGVNILQTEIEPNGAKTFQFPASSEVMMFVYYQSYSHNFTRWYYVASHIDGFYFGVMSSYIYITSGLTRSYSYDDRTITFKNNVSSPVNFLFVILNGSVDIVQ